jgi:hypothetical protein
MTDEELAEFHAWKRARSQDELANAFYDLEMSLDNPAGRGFNCVMPSQAYRTLARAIIALKKELING